MKSYYLRGNLIKLGFIKSGLVCGVVVSPLLPTFAYPCEQSFRNNTYALGIVSLSTSPVYPRFPYGSTFTYYAGEQTGTDSFDFHVEDRIFNTSSVPGKVTINV
eukprot:322976-Pyramimonas_sp.AAC.1